MFTLEREKFRYYKVKRGQEPSEVSRELKLPPHALFCGQVVEVRAYKTYCCKVGDTYESVAEKVGANFFELKKINGCTPLFPTRILFVPAR